VEKAMFNETSSYENLKSNLENRFDLSPLKSEFLLFWQKWSYLHIQLFSELQIGVYKTFMAPEDLELITQKFMKKRLGIISAFTQRIRNVINEHDENFKTILKQILSKLLIELNRLQSLRKVTNAYKNNQYSLGG
jgi:hypothetical protein